VVKSSAWFAETEHFFARSRFDYIDSYLEEFTAENLEAVIATAIERQEEAEGVKAVSYDQQKESFTSEKLDFDTLYAEIEAIGGELAQNDKLDEVVDLVEKNLGKGKKLTDAKKGQEEMLSILLDDLKELAQEE
jgi:hypothetical protein